MSLNYIVYNYNTDIYIYYNLRFVEIVKKKKIVIYRLRT